MSERESASPVTAPPPGLAARLFGIDPRALATLRISMALILLADLAVRIGDFEALHTDVGVLPGWLVADSSWIAIAPLHLVSGAFWYQAALFGIAAAFALMMLVGRFTRVATLASWLLLLSLHSRVQLFVDFGDTILRLLMFWSVFLPLGLRWSVDARRRPPDPERARRPVVSVASAGLLLQVASIYFFTALLKSGDEWRVDGTAVEVALHWDWSLLPFGKFMLNETPWSLQAATYGTLALEFLGPLLLFCPVATPAIRAVTATLFIVFQAGLGVSIVLGLMPWINSVMMFAFLPSLWWDAVAGVPGLARLGRLLPARAAAPSPRGPVRPAGPTVPAVERPRSWQRLGVEAFAGVCLAYVLAYNTVGLFPEATFPESLNRFGHFLRINQRWSMFTPNSPRNDGWYVIPARLVDGSVVELTNGGEVKWEKPPLISAVHEGRRWQVFQMRIALPVFQRPDRMHYRERYAEFLCRRWNTDHPADKHVVTLEVIHIDEITPEDLSEQPEQVPRLLVRHQCGAPYRTRA
jgi:hypothetical protein